MKDHIKKMIRLSTNPAVIELAEICNDIRKLHERIDAFMEVHGPECSCKCCKAVKEDYAGFPGVWDQLTTVSTIAWNANLMDSERPKSSREVGEMYDRWEKHLTEAKSKDAEPVPA